LRIVPRALLVAVGLVAGFWVRPGFAQCDTTTTATLLKRLGEAVDGYRTARQFWVAASYTFPHTVLGVFVDSRSARAAVEEAGLCFNAFGPYVGWPDSTMDRPMLLAGGTNHRPDSRYDSLFTSKDLVPQEMVDEIQVITLTRDGRTLRTIYRGRDVPDALFFSLSAIDKFLIPYYGRLYGVDFARDIRANYVRMFRR